MDARWTKGLFVGKDPKTESYWIATDQGMVRSRWIKRLTVEEQVDKERIKSLGYVPWGAVASQVRAEALPDTGGRVKSCFDGIICTGGRCERTRHVSNSCSAEKVASILARSWKNTKMRSVCIGTKR